MMNSYLVREDLVQRVAVRPQRHSAARVDLVHVDSLVDVDDVLALGVHLHKKNILRIRLEDVKVKSVAYLDEDLLLVHHLAHFSDV